MKGAPPLIRALLLTSLILTIGRGLTLPFLAIFLTQQRFMTPVQTGLVLGAGLTLAILLSLYGGYLVDSFPKTRLILCSMVCLGVSFFLLPLTASVIFLIILMALINFSYSLFSLSIKAILAEWLTVSDRIKAFSANHTLVNVGWAVGPPLSVAIAVKHPLSPFFLAGIISLMATLLLGKLLPNFGSTPQQKVEKSSSVTKQRYNFSQTLSILSRDWRFVWFILGGTLGSFVSSQFASCISQYLMIAFDPDFAYKVLGIILPINASIVVLLQYLISRNITREALMKWLTFGSIFFLCGLILIIFAQRSIQLWIIAIAIFSLGEIIFIPVEYIFVDFIAPTNLKGSYYGMQNISSLGGAVNPLLTGILLTYTPPITIFVVMMLATLLSLYLFLKGFLLAIKCSRTGE
ncbi:putative sulfoacetate transporter SauU [Candidatus Hoaglandella endobia]|uniref:Putative sulfoacetate transporter SauU n=2 Tax=Candidatus Hoaglandella endobia TaxID=1778263 RepID=A0A143WUQ2_9ENTR|nr:putative sulfoacetate transporter SauU [Candidatus Hoaglandella endobia]